MRGRRKLTNLVQEQRPTGRGTNQSKVIRHGAGECATKMPEQLAVDDRFRDRPAVHRDKRTGLTSAVPVNPFRKVTFPDTGFTGQQHRA